MSLAHNALNVEDSANYKFNPAKADTISTSQNIGTTTEPFVESYESYNEWTWKTDITNLYIKYLGREPEPGVLNDYWYGEYKKDRTIASFENEISTSVERAHYIVPYDTTITYTIDPTSTDNLNTNRATAMKEDIDKVKSRQNKLEAENAVKQTLLDEITSNINYNVMAMTIWVPLGILAGYYLYKKNVGVPQPK